MTRKGLSRQSGVVLHFFLLPPDAPGGDLELMLYRINHISVPGHSSFPITGLHTCMKCLFTIKNQAAPDGAA